jgi:carbon-monoxide dehydrogenase large subunit
VIIDTAMPAGTRYVGAPVRRREDRKFLTGSSTFVSDIARPGLLHAVIVRSPLAHATITSINLEPAKAAEGVVAIFTHQDFAHLPPLPVTWVFPEGQATAPPQPLLAAGRVRYVGEPIAVVIAIDEYLAADAAALVDIDYQQSPAVTDAYEAWQPDSPLLFDGTPRNVAFDRVVVSGDIDAAERDADVTVTARIRNQRLIPAPIEPRAVLAEHDPASDHTTLFSSTQGPQNIRTQIAAMTGIPENRLRVVAPDVGGGFGAKLALYREEVIFTLATRILNRPVRWVESRSETFLAMTHGRDHVQDVTVSATREGQITGLRVQCYANLGAYLSSLGEGVPGHNYSFMTGGNYRIPNRHIRVLGMMTNTTPVDTYRGAGRPEATFMIERIVDLVAEATGLDALEVRRRNFITEFPYLPTETTYLLTIDSGDYHGALDKLHAEIELDRERSRQLALRQQGRLLGIGIACYVEFTGFGVTFAHRLVGLKRGGYETAHVHVHADGRVTVYSGVSSHGQGHHTTLAQVVADRMQICLDDVEIVQSDTALVPVGHGTFNSRSMPVGAAAIVMAVDRVIEKAKLIAAELFEADPADIQLADGSFSAKGSPSRALGWRDVAAEAHWGGFLSGVEPTLEAQATFEPHGFPCAFGAHGCVVEVDPETGTVRLDRLIAVDDCGNILNPLIATGQVHGGLAQGIAQAIWEGTAYEADGQPIATSFMTYRMPRAEDFPRFETHHTITPTPLNPLGVKGVAECGTIGSTYAVYAAVLDAIKHLGVTNLDMPLTPEKIWRSINAGGQS